MSGAGDSNTVSYQADPREWEEMRRLAVIGELTAAMAHEVLNPLSAVLNLSMLVDKLASSESVSGEALKETRRHMSDIVAELSRVCRLISDLRTFSVSGVDRPGRLELNAAVEAALRLSSHRLRLDGIEVDACLAPGLPGVDGSRGRLQLLALDMILSAAAASRGRRGGGIVVSTGLLEGGAMVFLAVDDRGTELPPVRPGRSEDIARPAEEAPPLGIIRLAAARAVAGAYGGAIEVKGETGPGFGFRAVLPVAGNLR